MKKGFSLAEMTIVLSIITLFLVIALPIIMNKPKDKTKLKRGQFECYISGGSIYQQITKSGIAQDPIVQPSGYCTFDYNIAKNTAYVLVLYSGGGANGGTYGGKAGTLKKIFYTKLSENLYIKPGAAGVGTIVSKQTDFEESDTAAAGSGVTDVFAGEVSELHKYIKTGGYSSIVENMGDGGASGSAGQPGGALIVW